MRGHLAPGLSTPPRDGPRETAVASPRLLPTPTKRTRPGSPAREKQSPPVAPPSSPQTRSSTAKRPRFRPLSPKDALFLPPPPIIAAIWKPATVVLRAAADFLPLSSTPDFSPLSSTSAPALAAHNEWHGAGSLRPISFRAIHLPSPRSLDMLSLSESLSSAALSGLGRRARAVDTPPSGANAFEVQVGLFHAPRRETHFVTRGEGGRSPNAPREPSSHGAHRLRLSSLAARVQVGGLSCSSPNGSSSDSHDSLFSLTECRLRQSGSMPSPQSHASWTPTGAPAFQAELGSAEHPPRCAHL